MTTVAPTVDARADGPLLTFRCTHCRRTHTHGRHNPATGCRYDQFNRVPCTCPAGTGDGHRVAHCHARTSPYRDGGYVLREVTK